MKILKSTLFVVLASLLTSCGAYFNQPIDVQEARIGESTDITQSLRNLPLPAEPVVVGVYNFRDLTGQYKPSEVGSTFSTAVTQGATAILINALEDSRWFTPIERENIGNLLNERNIIRSTRQEYQGNSNQPQVPPLLYAGILLEGGIVSYDTNIITGGMGARYFGVGGSTQYRQDRITIYLRAISTSSGKILKNVYVSKTILSQAVDVSLYKYVSFQRLLEVETGFTRNEPVQLAVKEAIEKAVEGLIVEGLKDKLWNTEDEAQAQVLISEYEEEKEEAGLTELYDRKLTERNSNGYFGVNFGATLLSGDYSSSSPGFLGEVEYSHQLTPAFSLNVGGSFFELSNGGSFQEKFAGADLNAQFKILPKDKLSPYIYGGPGYVFSLASDVPEDFSSSFFKLQYGLGVEYFLSENIALKAFGEHNLSFSDEVDYMVNGKRDDFYFNFGAGINFYFGN
ncbi:CsgG/HfaB family protein [Salinimicrobium sp. GXAS 041]|uniref:CsgG/HfaB family protein n=1 Tax=Salinimicrobium sp. GXAS 041 TaxID=3400806 RepID=UPI003C74195E